MTPFKLITGDCREIKEPGLFGMILADPPYGDTSLDWDKRVKGWQGEFAFRLNDGDVKHHTLDRLASMFAAAIGQRLTYKELIA